MPLPAPVSLILVTTGPIAPAAACLILAPVPVIPVVTRTEVSVFSCGRYTDRPVPEAVLVVAGTTSEPDNRLV